MKAAAQSLGSSGVRQMRQRPNVQAYSPLGNLRVLPLLFQLEAGSKTERPLCDRFPQAGPGRIGGHTSQTLCEP